MGTRSIGGQQEQPLSPGDFGQSGGFRGPPGGFQGQPGGFQGQPGGFQGQPGGFQGQPGGFQGQPGGVQGQVGQQQGVGMPEQVPVNLSPQDKMVLQGALDILKEGRAALATGTLEGPVAERLTAAHAYVSGFLEARGIEELGGYLATIPQVTTRGTPMEDPEYDQMIDEFEGFLADDTQTRLPWGKIIRKGVPIAVKLGYKYGQHRKWW